jgi:NitT/TauT family transport system permease protein
MDTLKTFMLRIKILMFSKNYLVFSLALFLWFAISLTEWAGESPNNLWFAKTGEVVSAIFDIIISQKTQVLATFIRVFISVTSVVLIGSILGIYIGYFKSLYDHLKMPIDFWRSIPPIIVIPIMYRWDPSGTNEYFWRIGLVFFGCLPIMIMLIADAINRTSKEKLLIFQSMNTSAKFKIKNIIIYEIAPYVFSGTRTVISLAVVIIIVSEMILSPEQGIGRQIIHYQTAYEIQFVYGYAFIVGLIGMALNRTLRTYEKKIISWV